MIALRLLAPVLIDFRCVAGSTLRDPIRYADFWARCQELADAARDPVSGTGLAATFTHTEPTSSLNLYRVLDRDSSGRPFHLLEGTLDASLLPDIFPDGAVPQAPGVSVGEIAFQLHDHGIVLVETVLEVQEFLGTRDLKDSLDHLQELTTRLGEQIAHALVTDHLDPLLTQVRDRDRDREFVLAQTDPQDPVVDDFGHPMWVTRSLFVPRTPGRLRDAALRHWLKDVVLADEATPPAASLIAGGAESCVRWVNYAFLDDRPDAASVPPGSPHQEEWQGLRHAQVFYAALDRIDSLLSQVLADSAAADSGWELQHLKQSLMDLSQRAELVIMERQRVSKYLRPPVRGAMEQILGFWDHDHLVERPVRFKIEMCDRRLAELASRRGARSALFTDLILLGIGVTSILATALALTEFGRSATTDAGQSGYDLGRSSLIEWFAGQPADAILVVSGTLSLLLVALYLFFRREES